MSPRESKSATTGWEETEQSLPDSLPIYLANPTSPPSRPLSLGGTKGMYLNILEVEVEDKFYFLVSF